LFIGLNPMSVAVVAVVEPAVPLMMMSRPGRIFCPDNSPRSIPVAENTLTGTPLELFQTGFSPKKMVTVQPHLLLKCKEFCGGN